ncbi:AIPR family protein [Paenibacillus sp. NPDC055715]
MSKNTQTILEQIISEEHSNHNEFVKKDDFFEFFASSCRLKKYELNTEEIEFGLTGEGNDGGADSIYTFVNGDLIKEDDEDIKERYKKNVEIELFIFQAKNTTSFNETPILKFGKLSENLLDLDFNESEFVSRYTDKIISSFDLFRKTYISLITKKPSLTIRYVYVSKGIEIHPNVRVQSEELEEKLRRMFSTADVCFEFLGAQELVDLSQERVNDIYKLKTVENPMTHQDQKVYIALVKLSDFYNFITDKESGKLIKHIFESNVRDYQGKSSVNNEIYNTLQTDNRSEFWWLNNGITILSGAAYTSSGREITIESPEIVNGLQTSNEIYKYFIQNPEKIGNETRSVLVKIIVPEDDESRDKIIKATNSQTTIPKSSLRTTDLIHRQIEEFFKRKGLYYDRRKNFYKNEGKKSREIVSVAFLSQCLMSVFLQKPDYARARPSTLLESDDEYNKLFNPETDLESYYIVAHVGKKIEIALKESGSYSVPEVNNIRFYVLYSLFALKLQNQYPSAKKIVRIKLEDIQNEEILEKAKVIYRMFLSFGGTDKIAKSQQFRNVVMKEIDEIINNKLVKV